MKKSIVALLLSMSILTGCGAAESSASVPTENSVSEESFSHEDADSAEALPTPTRTTSSGTPIISYDDFDQYIGENFEYYDVDSTCFSTIGYDSKDQILYTQFLDSGSEYLYLDVPEDVFDSLHDAESIGRYYNKNIKGSYECYKIE